MTTAKILHLVFFFTILAVCILRIAFSIWLHRHYRNKP